MTSGPSDIDWSGVSLDTVRQIHSEGQVYLSAQLQAAIAADQRAVTMASVLAATAAALVAAGVAVFQTAQDGRALSACIAAGLVLLFAAACGAWAARPIAFWFPGNTPSSWYDVRRGDFIQNLGGEAENYSDHIARNNEILDGNQNAMLFGMVAAILAPVVAFVTWMMTST